jgi:hypothetical protein
VAIGFRLISQSSASLIACFHQSNQIPSHLHKNAKALFDFALDNERRVGNLPTASFR